jgi:hypothetical protein
MEASQWTFGEDVNLLAGVYGYALNSGTAPSFGGYFYNLKAKGLMLGTKYVTATGTYLTDAMSLVVGFTSSQAIVYLPASTREGQTILFKQWWTGYMRVYPRNGQAIYDDSSANDYIDVGEGRMMVASFVKASISGNTVQAWVIKLL